MARSFMDNIPLSVTPHPDDAESLARARRKLQLALDAQAHRERAIVAGTATVEMIEAALRDRYLSRALAGPRLTVRR